MRVDTRWRGIVLTPAAGQPASDTYCLVMLLEPDSEVRSLSSGQQLEFMLRQLIGRQQVDHAKAGKPAAKEIVKGHV